jgi:hypothetical protein
VDCFPFDFLPTVWKGSNFFTFSPTCVLVCLPDLSHTVWSPYVLLLHCAKGMEGEAQSSFFHEEGMESPTPLTVLFPVTSAPPSPEFSL